MAKILKKDLTPSQLVDYCIEHSEMVVECSDMGLAPDWITITITGELSAIPSLKNSKFRGIPNKVTSSKLKALTRLWQQSVRQDVYYGATKLHGMAIHAKRRNNFDADNATTTISDWLEPATKTVGAKRHDRGWGIGIIANDNTLTLYPGKANDLGHEEHETKIILCPYENVVSELFDLYMAHFKGELL